MFVVFSAVNIGNDPSDQEQKTVYFLGGFFDQSKTPPKYKNLLQKYFQYILLWFKFYLRYFDKAGSLYREV